MPLFDAIESDVTAFFVSQGTVFDALVKSFMDRVALVESSVAVLRTDVTNNFSLLSHRIDASNVAAAEVSAATAAAAAAAAASAALASLPMGDYASSPPVATVVDSGGGRNEELEYYVMTLSRQLNMVLEVLFQPHDNNVVEVVQAKQTQMHSISDVLTENEAMLMQLAIQHDDPKIPSVESSVIPDADGNNVTIVVEDAAEAPIHSSESNVKTQLNYPNEVPSSETLTSSDLKPHDQSRKSSLVLPKQMSESSNFEGVMHHQEPDQSQQTVVASTPSLEAIRPLAPESQPTVAVSHTTAKESQPSSPGSNLKSNQSVPALKQLVETISPHLDASPLTKKEDIARTVDLQLDNQIGSQRANERDGDSDEERDHMPQLQSQPTHHEGSLHRTRSFFRNCQDLQRLEETRLREQRRREEELMRRMHELLLQSRSHIQQEHMEVWRQQQDNATQNQQQMIFHLQDQLQMQQQALQEREQEWRQQQDQQREADLATIHCEMDRKLEAFSGIVAAAQATQGHELAQAMQLISDFGNQCVSPDALEAAGALWLKTAADNCIYGANPDTLSMLLKNLLGFQDQLKLLTVKTPAITSLHEAVDRAVQLLQRTVAPDYDFAKGPEQENTMYTLRQLLAKVDTSYRTARTEHEDLQFPIVGFLPQVIHQMELGTANLLDAVDFQHEHFQQSLAQQQAGLEKLQKELGRQQDVEKALRIQLGSCPSKEDTLRLVQELRDQITTATADSASRMLDTVDDLRYRMAGLPSSQMLERLAIDLHAKTEKITSELDATTGKLTHDIGQKADRAEIARLQSLLESGNGISMPPAYLTKSPLRCLSCDQHLPFAQAPRDEHAHPEPESNSGSPTAQRPGSPSRSPPSSPPRPLIYHNQQPQQLSYSYQQYAGYSPSSGVYNDLGINMGILEELFVASTSALERRRRQRQHLQIQLMTPHTGNDNDWRQRRPTFLNIDDGRNRIPLRKTQLSDQVIYGPAITPNAFRKLGRPDEYVQTYVLM
ncbi:unnamed protein product [Phytophthora lilii]|uniref:Unnamed protein product n=1 Tax=Phytophthora lilii TaxID=2077276 RepID=A0A9W6WW48_9STRA|nr:unnamed protein product [Phytophthora lilii]